MANSNRAKALRDALLEFLYEQRNERDNRTVLPTAFVGTREAAAFNPAPAVDELTGAVAFLDEEGYINGTQALGGNFVFTFLTPRGMRAVEEGHLTGPRPGADGE